MKQEKKYSLILASKSPRRKELLGWINIPFTIHDSKIIEKNSLKLSPEKNAESLARQKGLATYQLLEGKDDFGKIFFPLIIAADTIVTLDKKIYGKPKDREDAFNILSELSGKTHKVITGVYLGTLNLNNNEYQEKIFSCSTQVTFADINKDIMDIYIASEESLDKAGAYGIQGQGLVFIEKIMGSYSNVVGFPLTDFIFELKSFLGFSDCTDGIWRQSIYGG